MDGGVADDGVAFTDVLHQGLSAAHWRVVDALQSRDMLAALNELRCYTLKSSWVVPCAGSTFCCIHS
jgi:hypothetical protein